MLAILAEHGPDAKVLAGGQSLVPRMALRLERLGGIPARLVEVLIRRAIEQAAEQIDRASG